ncbi:MAG: hypothetical protein DWH82_00810 [Planctomycetota bacterium]|nr:MAG: hypothetical protein DWH82_00810 [Planctomycetota bacterium]
MWVAGAGLAHGKVYKPLPLVKNLRQGEGFTNLAPENLQFLHNHAYLNQLADLFLTGGGCGPMRGDAKTRA